MRTLIIGDVHGCLDELDELLRAAALRRGADRLVFVGDLVDRGPDPVGVVRRVRELGAACVLGNHEEKHLRWARREAERRATGRPNAMRPFDEQRLREHAALGAEHLAWFASLPLVLEPAPGWRVVHAGFEADRAPGQQRPGTCLRVRYVDERGRMRPSEAGEKPPGTVRWATRWPGPDCVIYGHAVYDLARPTIDDPAPGVRCHGIDTGCCFGGHLTALVLPGRPGFDVEAVELVQVPARAAYHPFTASDG